jgi:hypothetical protein
MRQHCKRRARTSRGATKESKRYTCRPSVRSSQLINESELCKHSEDLSAEEKIAELLPINVQHLYVLERLGKVDDAGRVSSEIAVEKYVSLAGYLVDPD